MERRAFLTRSVGTGAIVAVASQALMPTMARGSDFSHFNIDGALVLHAYRGLVEEHLGGSLRTLKSLAVTSDAQRADWDTIKPALVSMKADLATAATIWLAQPDGSYATTEMGPTSQNLKDRAYFSKVLAGRDEVGSLVVSKSTGVRSTIVATPVLRQGQVVALLGASLDAGRLSQLVIDRVGMPESLTFYALDAHGQTAIHKDPTKMFQFPSDMGSPSLSSAVQIILLQPNGMAYYEFEGIGRKAIFDTSELTGWHFVLAQQAN